MVPVYKHFEIEAVIKLYSSDKGRRSFIADGYRPNIYFGYDDPANPNFASDCIVKLKNRSKLYPNETDTVVIFILKYDHLSGLLERNVRIKIKEGLRFVGEGKISKIIGVK